MVSLTTRGSSCQDQGRTRPGKRRSRLGWLFKTKSCTSLTFILTLVCYRFGFDYGLIHFVMMSTEHDFNIGTEQYYFLKEHLESVDRSVTPWLIFTGHR